MIRRALIRAILVLSWLLVFLSCASLVSCHDRGRQGPVVIVDPGPPFGPRPTVRVRGARRLADGSVVLVLVQELRMR